MLTRIKASTMVEQVNEELLRYIDQNNLQAGDSLPSIGALSEQLGASKAVIREALKSMEAKGIIEIANGKKAKIKPITCEPLLSYFQRCMKVENKTAAEFAEIRKALELQCVSSAIKRGTEEELASLEVVVREMRDNLINAEVFAELDVKFHLLIAHATHNTMMVHLLESIRDPIRESIRRGLHKRLTQSQMETVQGFHERLVENMLARDEAKAILAMNAHFDEIAMSLE